MDDTKKKKTKKQGKSKRSNSSLKRIFCCWSLYDDDKSLDDVRFTPKNVETYSKTTTCDELMGYMSPSAVVIETKKKCSACMTDLNPSYSFSSEVLPIKTEDKSVTTHEIMDSAEHMTRNDSQGLEQMSQRSPFTKSNILDKNLTDQLVKTILCKYLEVKSVQEENMNQIKHEKGVVRKVLPLEQNNKNERLKMEYFDQSDVEPNVYFNQINSSNTSILPYKKKVKTRGVDNPQLSSEESEDLGKTKEFPTKTKSAPTNSAARDSLADICSKYSHYNQHENYVDSSESYTEDNESCKKKLELIFDKSSADICDDGTEVPLDYKISCEKTPVNTGIHRQDSILQYERNQQLKEVRRKTITSQELQIQPSATGEFNGYTDSTASLKWKLIISHHKDLQ